MSCYIEQLVIERANPTCDYIRSIWFKLGGFLSSDAPGLKPCDPTGTFAKSNLCSRLELQISLTSMSRLLKVSSGAGSRSIHAPKASGYSTCNVLLKPKTDFAKAK